jgi:tRNA-modifying protein YgfZ
VRVQGPDAVDYLNRMLSNDVPEQGSVDALLLTAKARVIAPVLVWRRGADDVLLLTEPELGDVLRTQLARMRFAAKCEVEAEEHTSTIVFGDDPDGIANRDYGIPATELLDRELDATIPDEELERLRIEAATPRFGREIDDRVLPAEAGLDERAVSFTKGCYPGQEPIARLHYRGHVNRKLQVVELDAEPAVERVTSSARRPDGSTVALAYVRTKGA